MNIVTLIGLVAVASVLIIAGIGKLMTPASTAEAYREIRMPRPFWHPGLVAALAVVELVVGLALVLATDPLIVIGSRLTALILTIGFFGASIRTMNADRADCGCFGAMGSMRTGAPAIIRNGVLLVCSAFLAVASFFELPSTLHFLALPALGVVLGMTIIVRMRFRSPTIIDMAQTPQQVSVYVGSNCGGCTTVLTTLNHAAMNDPSTLAGAEIFAEMQPAVFAAQYPALAPHFRRLSNLDRRAVGIAHVPAVTYPDPAGNASTQLGTRAVLGAFGLTLAELEPTSRAEWSPASAESS